MDQRTLLFSVQPRFAEKLFEGEKTVELRRVLPRRIRAGDFLLIYATAPVKRFIGFCRVTKVLQGSPQTLWPQVKDLASVTRAEYRRYFLRASRAFGIQIGQPVRLLAEVSLEEIRRYAPDFRPPQSFRYLSRLDEDLRRALRTSMQRAYARRMQPVSMAEEM